MWHLGWDLSMRAWVWRNVAKERGPGGWAARRRSEVEMSLISARNKSKDAATGTVDPGWQVAQHRIWAEGGTGGRGPANQYKPWKIVEIVPYSYGTQQRLSARKSHICFITIFKSHYWQFLKYTYFCMSTSCDPWVFLSRPLSSPLHSHRVPAHTLLLFLPCQFSGFCLLLSLPCSDSSYIPLISKLLPLPAYMHLF